MSKNLFKLLAFISGVLAVIIAVTPLSNIAIAPISVAFISGLIVLFLSKKEGTKTKTIQYIFLLVIISLSITLYKAIFSETEVGDTEQLEERDEENLEDSKEILKDIEIDEEF